MPIWNPFTWLKRKLAPLPSVPSTPIVEPPSQQQNVKQIIAGQRGELIINEILADLPAEYIVKPNFTWFFADPLEWYKDNNRQNYPALIHNVQIDHLIVCHAGIILIETKNWNQTSWDKNMEEKYTVYDQVYRAAFAIKSLVKRLLFRVPIYSVIVNINNVRHYHTPPHIAIIDKSRIREYCLTKNHELLSMGQVKKLCKHLRIPCEVYGGK